MSEPRTWIASDTHFGHSAIIDPDAYGHCIHPPFRDVDDMDRQLIERWNARVGKGDTIFHLGDIAWNEDALMRVCAELNGVKNLILGNHDTLEAGVYWEAGFKVVNGNYSYRAGDDEYVMLSHAPVHESCLTMPGVAILGSIHGHVHEKPAPTERHVNVSVERTGYEPILVEDAIAILREQSHQQVREARLTSNA